MWVFKSDTLVDISGSPTYLCEQVFTIIEAAEMVQRPFDTSSESSPRCDSRALRAALFWCARWLFGRDHYHRGSLCIRVSAGRRKGEVLELMPDQSDDVFPPDGGPISSDNTETMAMLLRSYLSDDERSVIAVIAERGPVAAKVAVERSGLERSRGYVILSLLSSRCLVIDGKGGYEVNREIWSIIG